jgi:hypothetical protein
MLKPDWTILTGLGTSKVNLKVHPPGYWGPDEAHRVEGALQAVSSRLLRSSLDKAGGLWSMDEVTKLRSDYRNWEQARHAGAHGAQEMHEAEDDLVQRVQGLGFRV